MKIKKETWLTLVVFLVITAALVIIEVRPGFPDPDSFYHAKMAMIIKDQGFLKIFPWFQWTDLKNTYVDPHLLYHVLLIPFVTLFNPLVGMKISAVVFGLAAFLATFLSLRAYKIPKPLFFLLLAFLSFGLLHRISLPRAPALSIAFLLLVTWAMLKKRIWILFLTTIIFVWFYHGWPIVLLSLGAVTLANAISHRLFTQQKFFRDFCAGLWQERKIWLATIGGIVFGTVVNPYFPENIKFSVLDIFKIGVVNYQSILCVGQEWLPKTPLDFLASTAFISCAFVIALGLFIPGLLVSKTPPKKDEMITLLTLIFLAGGYSILTLKSSRFIEYAVPFITLAAGALAISGQHFWQQKIKPLVDRVLKNLALKIIVGATIFLIAGGVTFNNISRIAEANDKFSAATFQPAADWIKNNVPENQTIFHNSWDFSLILWYLDDSHYYLVGLDPTFMYDYDPEAYDVWWKLVTAEDSDVSKIITVFNAKTVVVNSSQFKSQEFITNLENSGLFQRVVNESGVKVFTTVDL